MWDVFKALGPNQIMLMLRLQQEPPPKKKNLRIVPRPALYQHQATTTKKTPLEINT